MVRLITLILALNLVAYSAEDDKSHTAKDATLAGAPTRIEASQKLPNKVVGFISKSFNFGEDVVREHYDIGSKMPLPPAVEKAFKEKNEEDLSKIISELMGVVNLEQLKEVSKQAEELAKEERKDPEKTDERFALFLDRIQWAAKLREGKEEKDEKAKKFNEQFKKDYAKTQEWNTIANEKIAQAATGNEKAKQWVRENVSMKSILSFAEAQKKSGNAEAANKIVGALSFKQGNERFLDMFGKGPEAQRLYLGKNDASLNKAVDAFFKEKTSFGNNIASRKEHPAPPEKSWFVGDDGKFTKGNPAGFEAPKRDGQGGGGGQGGAQTPRPNTDAGPLRQFVSTQCARCHEIKVSGNSLLDAKIEKNGKSIPITDIPNILRTNARMAGQISEDVIRSIQTFADVQRRGK